MSRRIRALVLAMESIEPGSSALFLENMQVRCESTPKKLTDFSYGRLTAEEIIDYAFCWSTTEQGHNYWGDICDKINSKFIEALRNEPDPGWYSYQ